MKKTTKNILKNSIIVFLIYFLFLCIIIVCSDYVHNGELLVENLLLDLRTALSWTTTIMIIFVPVLVFLEKTKNTKFSRKNSTFAKIIITLIVALIIGYIYICLNLKFEF